MFGKKKNRTLFNAVDDSKSVVHDFCQRMPWISYRAVEYRLYHKLSEKEMLPKLEDHLTKVFAGDIDDANGDILDAILFSAVREGVADLECQRIDHGDTLRRLIVSRKSNYEDICRIKEAREHEYEEIKSEYNRICHLIEKENKEV